eukprot:815594-Rhodomonas_salina.2
MALLGQSRAAGIPGGAQHQRQVRCEIKRKHPPSQYIAARTPRNQTQETAFLVQIVLRLRFLVLDFGVQAADGVRSPEARA